MIVTKFDAVFNEFIEKEKALLEAKRADYAKGDSDCLVNFKEASAMLETTPELYCSTLFMKHIQSITKAVKSGGINPQDWCWASPRGEGMKQHIADARNLLLLLAALIQDGMDQTIVTDISD